MIGWRRVPLGLLAAIALLACGVADGEGEVGAGPDLEPRLWKDAAEIQAYLEAFPLDRHGIHDVPGVGRFYLDDNPARVKQTLRSGRPHEPHVVAAFERSVVPGSTVLDVGAHIGSHSVTLARLVGPEGRVYAFEPQRKVFRELVHNLELNGLAQAVPLRFAISSEPGILEMDPIQGADGQVAIGEGGDRVEARTLDSFGFRDVSLIKIDVEGHQLEVLKGAEHILNRDHPVVIIEIRPRDADAKATRQKLRELGYRLTRLKGADFLALHEGAAAR